MIETLQQLHWIRPAWLLLIPVAVILFIAIYRLRSKSSGWYQHIDPSLIEFLLDNPANHNVRASSALPLIAAALACCIAIVAMAGPSWEKLPTVTEQKTDALVIIADLTLSMHATDIKPSRLVRARYKLLELLKQRKEGQTALIAYSGDAHTVSPLTDDARTIAALVPSLSPEIMPSIGSNAIAAFESANQLLANANINKAKIVWFTDEALTIDQRGIASLVNQRNSRLVIVGIGTSAGGPVPLPSGKFVKDTNGQVVNAPLSRDALRSIARDSDGDYLDLQADNRDVDFILSNTLQQRLGNSDAGANQHNEQREESGEFSDRWYDQGATLALLLIPFALLSFRRGWLLSLYLTVYLAPVPTVDAADDGTSTESSSGWQSLWQTRDQRAYQLHQQEKFDQASTLFDDPKWRGIAEYESGQYAQAVETLSQDLEADSAKSLAPAPLAAQHYNHGHSLARAGDLDGAIAAYEQALKLQPDLEDAATAKALVESLKNQQQQSQQNSQSPQQQDQNQQDADDASEQQQSQQDNAQSQQQNDQLQSDQQQADQQNSSDQQSNENQQSDSNSDQLLEQEAARQAAQEAEQQDQTQQGEENDEQREQTLSENIAQQMQPGDEGSDDAQQNAAAIADMEALDAEQQAKLEQWLNKIPDDPGGLLRRKFRYERQLREQQGNVIDEREQGQLW